MKGKSKAATIGRLLKSSVEIDTIRGENKKLQSILGDKLYFQKSSKWYYNIQRLKKITISEINNLTEKIEKTKE